MNELSETKGLRRVLGLPLLVFYGVGVTVGAGIFALVGEILAMAGEGAPLAFMLAAVLASLSAGSYAMLSHRFPRAAGAALYVGEAFGPSLARIAGLGVAVTAIFSSAVISLAFANYVASILPFPTPILAIGLIAILAGITCLGVRESIWTAAAVTLLEVGTLVLIIALGIPELGQASLWGSVLTPPGDWPSLGIVAAAAAVAFFAFIGFEDIVNMAEETVRPERVLAPAIVVTLAITTVIYVLVTVVAVAVADRAEISASNAPMADLFTALTGWPGAPIAAIAAIAMINGVLVQIVMASRLLYGMARERLIPAWFGEVSAARQTPVRAAIVVAAVIAGLTLVAPLLSLARITSYITLAVFTLVSFSLFWIALRGTDRLRIPMAAWGLVAGLMTGGLLVFDVVRQIG
jgi:amino acid transporter